MDLRIFISASITEYEIVTDYLRRHGIPHDYTNKVNVWNVTKNEKHIGIHMCLIIYAGNDEIESELISLTSGAKIV